MCSKTVIIGKTLPVFPLCCLPLAGARFMCLAPAGLITFFAPLVLIPCQEATEVGLVSLLSKFAFLSKRPVNT